MKEQVEEWILGHIAQSYQVKSDLPHQAVIYDDAESTQLRIVSDCPAKQSAQLPSLNDCMENGPVLQPLLFRIISRNCKKRYCMTGSIKKAFLQLQISEDTMMLSEHCGMAT